MDGMILDTPVPKLSLWVSGRTCCWPWTQHTVRVVVHWEVRVCLFLWICVFLSISSLSKEHKRRFPSLFPPNICKWLRNTIHIQESEAHIHPLFFLPILSLQLDTPRLSLRFSARVPEKCPVVLCGWRPFSSKGSTQSMPLMHPSLAPTKCLCVNKKSSSRLLWHVRKLSENTETKVLGAPSLLHNLRTEQTRCSFPHTSVTISVYSCLQVSQLDIYIQCSGALVPHDCTLREPTSN